MSNSTCCSGTSPLLTCDPKKMTFTALLILAVAIDSIAGWPGNLPHSGTRSRQVAEDNNPPPPALNTFYLNLYKELVQASPGDNLVFSPKSIATALGMTLMGSRGRTYDQLAQALGLQGQNITLISDTFAQMVRMYQAKMSDYEVRASNLLYSSHLLEMKQDFYENILQTFKGHPEVVNFGESDAVRAKINSAVARETKNKIQDLIPLGLLNAHTRLVLVNAIYFKGLWKKPFPELQTRDRPFWESEDQSVMVPTMFVESVFKFYLGIEAGFFLAAMDYKDSNLSMVLVVPHKRMGLADVEAKLTSEDLVRIPLKEATDHLIKIYLPRFKLEVSKDLVQMLIKLGVTDLVTKGRCDLSGIGGNPGALYLSNLLHKTFIEVNEHGTEAAAATGLAITTFSNFGITADHPFMFYILDRSSSDILFMGRVTKFS